MFCLFQLFFQKLDDDKQQPLLKVDPTFRSKVDYIIVR